MQGERRVWLVRKRLGNPEKQDRPGEKKERRSQGPGHWAIMKKGKPGAKERTTEPAGKKPGTTAKPKRQSERVARGGEQLANFIEGEGKKGTGTKTNEKRIGKKGRIANSVLTCWGERKSSLPPWELTRGLVFGRGRPRSSESGVRKRRELRWVPH